MARLTIVMTEDQRRWQLRLDPLNNGIEIGFAGSAPAKRDRTCLAYFRCEGALQAREAKPRKPAAEILSDPEAERERVEGPPNSVGAKGGTRTPTVLPARS